jgi:hypothetical protein
METVIMENGLMTRLMEEEIMNISTEQYTVETGRRTDNMATVLKHGLMEPSMRVIMNMERNTELEHSNGQMDLLTSENFIITTSMEKEYTHGVITENMKENGEPTRCMEKAVSLGQMVGST